MSAQREEAAAKFPGAGGGDTAAQDGVRGNLLRGDGNAVHVLDVDLDRQGAGCGRIRHGRELADQLLAGQLQLLAAYRAIAGHAGT